MPVDVWRAPRSSVVGLDPGVVGNRPVPHLLMALLTPTRAPHARLLICGLERFLSGSLLPSRTSTLAFLPLLSPPLFFRLRFPLTSERTSIRFISVGHLRGRSPPQAHPAPLAHGYLDDPCALKEGGRRSLRKNVAEEK